MIIRLYPHSTFTTKFVISVTGLHEKDMKQLSQGLPFLNTQCLKCEKFKKWTKLRYLLVLVNKFYILLALKILIYTTDLRTAENLNFKTKGLKYNIRYLR